jgi:hypothetical protein
MADRFYYVEFGGKKGDVTEAAADSAGADVSLRITYDANANQKRAVLEALDAIRHRVIADTWPPA